jgi:AraC-like DNA-binding protein
MDKVKASLYYWNGQDMYIGRFPDNAKHQHHVIQIKEQMGIPVRRYLLWLRLRDAIKQILNGMSFTNATHHAGFSDSAHLSRTYKQMSGMTLTNYLKKSQFIQAISCPD